MRYLWLIISIVFLIAGCGNEHYERSKIVMNTVVTLKANGNNAERAVNEAFKKIIELEKNINNDTKKIEASAGNDDFIKISTEVYEMLKIAQKYSLMTDGAFDVTIGAAIDLWDFGSNKPQVPTNEEITTVKRLVGYQHLKLRDSDCSVKVDLVGIKINLGGIAKGYGVDVARKIFDSYKIRDGLIDFGTSTIYAFGTKRIGLKNPRNINELIDVIEISDSAISTSGDYMKFFIVDGQRYHHIINPKTCMPVDNEIAAVSVIVDGKAANCATSADILSTAIFVTGQKEASERFLNTNYIIYNKNDF